MRLSAPALFAAAAVAAPPVRIGFYTDKGAGGIGDLYRMVHWGAAQSFGDDGYTVANLSAAAVGKLSRTGFDVVVFPGGSGSGQSDAIGLKGRDAVRSFVRGGGGYIGTCGGAFLGLSHIHFYGTGIKTQGYPSACHAHGCNTSVQFSPQGLGDLGLPFGGDNVTIMYHNGPLAKAADFPANVTVVAAFRSEGRPWGTSGLGAGSDPLTNGTPAITSTEYGAGRVILNAPHPEHLPKLPASTQIYAGELSWVRPRDSASGYTLMPTGTCSGGTLPVVASADECGAAAAAVGERDTTAGTCSGDGTEPLGCYVHENQKTTRLWWCPTGDAAYAGSDRRAICRLPEYELMPTGTCANGTVPVTSAAECAEAAAAVGESDTAAGTCSDSAHPQGCYVHDGAKKTARLWWCPNGNPTYAGKDRHVICRH